MRLAKSKVHFVGIGGIGMSGLAELLHNMRARVSGSDLSENSNVQRLKALGVKTFAGHKTGQIGTADVVVYSSAVPFNNPEIIEAKSKKIPIIPRAEVLAEIMRLKRGVAIAGTHGKTTTTSLISTIFIQGNLDPTVVVGGRLDLIKSNSLLGQGQWLVAEADESDGSFLKLSPEIAVITNIDNDHLDYYKNMEQLDKAFLEFANRVPFYGAVIACGDDTRIRAVFRNYSKKILYYGFERENDFRLEGQKGRYRVYQHDKEIGNFALGLPGKHNAQNALAAIVASLETGVPFETCAEALGSFLGVDRRFQFKGEVKGIRIYDDYGHHPTEVKAVLQAFKEKFPDRKLFVVFQPHRYSRTQNCWKEFCESFTEADRVLLTDIYAASENPIAGITSERMSQEIGKRCTYVGSLEKAIESALSEIKEGDVLVTLGAGDVFKVGLKLIESLSAE